MIINKFNLKKYIPQTLLPLARELRYRLCRRDDNEEKLRQEIDDIQKQWQKIVNNSLSFMSNYNRLPKECNVLFVTGYGVGTHFLTFEPIVMMGLLARQCKISSLFCNISLPSCEFNAGGNNYPRCHNYWKPGVTNDAILYQCRKCKNNILSTYSIFPIDLYGYNQFLSPADYELAMDLAQNIPFKSFRYWEYEGVRIGEEAFASVLRVTFKGTLDDTPLNRELVKRYLISGILMAKAAQKAYESIKPDRIVLIHGVYLTHGIATKVANKMGIPVIVMGGGGLRKDTAILCHNKTYHLQLVSEPNNIWENYDISEKQKEQVLDYAIRKRSARGGADYLSYHPDPIEDADEIYKLLKIDRSRPIISLYTNVIWDAQIMYESNAFSNIFDWLFTSIEELGKNSNCWAVIRIHPAEVKGPCPTQQPMTEEIKKKFPKLPENIRVIGPESDISSYTLAQESKAAIIFGTKMGLEIALMRIPLVICADTFNRNKGYGLDIGSKEQYIELIKEIHNYPPANKEVYERALKYAHYFYFRKMIDLPITTIISHKIGGGKQLNISKLDDLLPGNLKGIDTICDGIINLSPLHIKSEDV